MYFSTIILDQLSGFSIACSILCQRSKDAPWTPWTLGLLFSSHDQTLLAIKGNVIQCNECIWRFDHIFQTDAHVHCDSYWLYYLSQRINDKKEELTIFLNWPLLFHHVYICSAQIILNCTFTYVLLA